MSVYTTNTARWTPSNHAPFKYDTYPPNQNQTKQARWTSPSSPWRRATSSSSSRRTGSGTSCPARRPSRCVVRHGWLGFWCGLRGCLFVCMYVDRRGLPWLFHWGLINHASTPPTKQTNQFVHNVMSAHVGALTEGGAGSGGDGGRGEVPGNRPGTCVCATELLVGAHPTVWPLFSTHPIHNSPINKQHSGHEDLRLDGQVLGRPRDHPRGHDGAQEEDGAVRF